MKILKFFLILFCVSLLTYICFYSVGLSEPFVGIDDANIYLIYMKNFANGHGFVYSIGKEKVEGFTSILWTLLGAILFHFSDAPENLLLVFNIVLVSTTLYIILNFIDDNEYSESKSNFLSFKSLLFFALIGLTPGFIDWTILSLLETGLWFFLVNITVFKILNYNKNENKIKHYISISILNILLTLCRPESMLIIPIIILLNTIKEFVFSKSFYIAFKWNFLNLMLFILSLFILVKWRLYYFGYPLPNTYYAKVSSDYLNNIKDGIGYLFNFFTQKPLMLVLLIYSFNFFLKTTISKSVANFCNEFIISSCVLLSIVFPLYSGGDYFKLQRFIIPFFPFYLLIGFYMIKHEYNFNKNSCLLLFFLYFFSNMFNLRNSWYFRNDPYYYPIKRDFSIASAGREYGKKLSEFFKDCKNLPSQGVYAAGAMAYDYVGESIDLLGLNNIKMAHAYKIKKKIRMKNHASFNRDTFFVLKPDLLWYEHSDFISSTDLFENIIKINNSCNVSKKKDFLNFCLEPFCLKVHFPSDGFFSVHFENLHNDIRFTSEYAFCRIHSKRIKNNILQIFAKKTFINSLDTSFYSICYLPYE